MAFITQIHKSRNDRGHLRPSGRGMGSGNGEGGCTNGKVARFIFNGFQWLKPTRSNRDHCPLSTLALRQKPPKCIISRKTKLTRRNKTNTARSQNVSPGKNGSFNIRQLPDWAKVTGPELVWPLDRGSSQRIRKDSVEIHKIFTEREPGIELFRQVAGRKVRICIAGELEALNPLRGIRMSAIIRKRSAALVRIWLGASHRYKAIFRQMGKQMYSNITLFTSHLFCQAICTLPVSLSLFCSVKWAMSSLHPSHCSLWGHSRNTRTLTNPRLSETVSSRPKEIERERASEKKVSWFQLTHHTFLIHCKGYFPSKGWIMF